MKFVRTLSAVLLSVLLLLSWSSCQKENVPLSGVASDWVTFSCDTLSFDTVFTAMGSTTRALKIYNITQQDIVLASVTLQGGYASRFRLNVDGDTSMVARNIPIPAGDSIFVFVRVNINPNASTEPFLVEDALCVTVQQEHLTLPLTAYGRNAVYHIPTDTLRNLEGEYYIDIFGNYYRYSVIDCDNWDHSRPHVIVGYAVVNSNTTLNLTAGDELYFYNDAVLWVYDSATLVAQGTEDRPVLFTSVRHDGWYDHQPGQWGYIWVSGGSVNTQIDHAIIENGYRGLLVDTNVNSNPTLRISNTEIRNHADVGLLCNTAWVTAQNVLVHTCGTAAVALLYGGRYDFGNCTLAGYWPYGTRKNGSLLMTNMYLYGETLYLYGFNSHFHDCIIYGTRNESEVETGLDDRAAVDTLFTHCLIKGGAWDEDPLFENPTEGDYHLKEGSPAEGIGYRYPVVATEKSRRRK